MRRTMQFGRVAHVMIGVHSDEAPSDEDWDAWLAACTQAPGQITHILAITDGQGPNASQRSRVVKAGTVGLPVAIVTGSVIARGIATAVSWTGQKIRSFTPGELNDAFEYLAIRDDATRRLAMQTVVDLKAKLAGSSYELIESASRNIADVTTSMQIVINERMANVRKHLDTISKRTRG